MVSVPRSHTSSVAVALSVYAESLVSGSRVLLAARAGEVGELELRLRELGARSVHSCDIDRSDLDVRDGAFDLALVPDLGRMSDPAGALRRLRRLVDPRGAVLAVGRAVIEDADTQALPEIAPAHVAYGQLYDLFALQFESVTMTGVLPFTGLVFAELGQGEDVAVSVDTRLAPPAVPGVFLVAASREPRELDPYAIVQIEPAPAPTTASRADEAALAAAQLKADLLGAQLDELRSRVASSSAKSAESAEERRAAADRIAVLTAEREDVLCRARELEGVLLALETALTNVEQRLAAAEQQVLERDDQIARLRGELDGLRGEGLDLAAPDPEAVVALVARAERAETALALNVSDLAHVAEAHASETAALEAHLRDRARVITAMEKELTRREQLVRELVASVEEAREARALGWPHSEDRAPSALESFETESPPSADPEELARLRRKLDELSLEIARREGELVAQAWRIEELERRPTSADASRGAEGQEGELAKVRDELDALRQALTQEHAARVAAESGEELTRARNELARQAALLEQLKGAQAQG